MSSTPRSDAALRIDIATLYNTTKELELELANTRSLLHELRAKVALAENDEEWSRVNKIKLRVTDGTWFASKPYHSSYFHAEGPTSSAAIRALRAKLATNMISIEDFATVHNACPAGRHWATQNCRDMQHVWETIRSSWLVWIALRPGVLDDKMLRLFAVYCARQMQPLITDAPSLTAIDVAERYANGLASAVELTAAHDATSDTVSQAHSCSTRIVGWLCTRLSALNAAFGVAHLASSYSMPTHEQQAAWLRANAKPNWAILNEEPSTNQ